MIIQPDENTLTCYGDSCEWHDLYKLYDYARIGIAPEHVYFVRTPEFRTDSRWRPVFTEPYWYDSVHRIIPMCPTAAVSESGKVVNINTKFNYNGWKEEYLMVSLPTPFRSAPMSAMRIHLLVANTWVLENQTSDNPICNHLDGNKHNPHASNLEWTTLSGNMQHALRTGLITSAKPCRLRNKDTGEILEFLSVKQVAKFLGRKPDHLYSETKYLNTLFGGIYELRVDGDSRPWLYENSIVMNDLSSRYIIIVTEPDGTKRVFNGAQYFAEYYNLRNTINPLSISQYVRRFSIKYPDFLLEVIDQHK